MMDQRKGSREHGLGLPKMPHATAACLAGEKLMEDTSENKVASPQVLFPSPFLGPLIGRT